MRTKIAVAAGTTAVAGIAGTAIVRRSRIGREVSALRAALRTIEAAPARKAICPEFTSHSQCEADLDCSGC